MEMLINGILTLGGKRKNLEIKLFGGGKVMRHIKSIDIGQQNIDFVRHYLKFEGLKIVAQDLGDKYPRKVYYFSDTGKVMMRKLVKVKNSAVYDREKEYFLLY